MAGGTSFSTKIKFKTSVVFYEKKNYTVELFSIIV